MVKTGLGPAKICWEREYSNYRLRAVASCQYIRTLYDVIEPDGGDAPVENTPKTEDPLCMVFEWMEHDLRIVPSDRFRECSNLPKTIAKSVLSALALLKTQYNAIHSGEGVFFALCLSMAK